MLAFAQRTLEKIGGSILYLDIAYYGYKHEHHRSCGQAAGTADE